VPDRASNTGWPDPVPERLSLDEPSDVDVALHPAGAPYPTRPVGFESYGRAMSVVLPYLPAGVDPAAIRMVAVCEALTESGDDFLSAPRDSMFVSNLVAAFQSGGAEIASVEDLVDLGVYLTVAVKAPKVTTAISTAEINEHAGLLATELDALPYVRVVVLMGDVAIKAMNAVARQRRQGRVIPSGSTYKLRHGEYRYGDVRVLPSYLPTGRSYLIERSKREMIAEDLRVALGLMST
jgi:hypothetical protein